MAIAALVFALARPTAVMAISYSRATIILALDVSGSMCATDISPNRFSAAQEAAKAFVLNQEAGTQVGVVAFAGFAELVMPPTRDQDALIQAIDGLTRARRTAVGSAILRSIDAIAEVNANVAPVNMGRGVGEIAPTPIPAGSYQPDIIVLLTDGSSNQGALPLDAAQLAAERGIRVYTIGFGTEHENTPRRCTPEQFGQRRTLRDRPEQLWRRWGGRWIWRRTPRFGRGDAHPNRGDDGRRVLSCGERRRAAPGLCQLAQVFHHHRRGARGVGCVRWRRGDPGPSGPGTGADVEPVGVKLLKALDAFQNVESCNWKPRPRRSKRWPALPTCSNRRVNRKRR
ncbi:MAG: VWA domain-containing protein [Caldilineaceae bacterium]|nr:VWA domain-containing protein [Caldilineaceae bacterium]